MSISDFLEKETMFSRKLSQPLSLNFWISFFVIEKHSKCLEIFAAKLDKEH
jgi:hypothetical protein